MLREIRKKLVIIENRKPFGADAVEYLEQTEEEDWICMNLRLEGSELTKEDVSSVIDGGCLRDVAISDYMLIDRTRRLRKLIYDGCARGEKLSKATLDRIYAIASDAKSVNSGLGLEGTDLSVDYRKTNPVIIQLSYNPPLPQEIREQMDLLFRWLYQKKDFFEVIKNAAHLHNRIIEIYPYPSCNEMVARTAMFYYLVQEGLPICNLLYSESEYNKTIVEYLRKENIDKLNEQLVRGIFNKLDLIMQVTDFK